MALDSEAKRWSMLRHIGGNTHVINPTGSNFDSQVERLTLLNIYGGELAGDVTAPVLSSATGTATGSTTATGTVSTDEGNGTLYYWATENASETAANIKANGSSQAVSASGVQNVFVTGLTAETGYYLHYVQDDDASNESNVESSAQFTTSEAAAENTGGWITGWDREQARRKREKEKREQEIIEAQEIQEEIEREAALLEIHIAEEGARKAELARINRLVADNRVELTKDYPALERIMSEALEQQTFSKMERLERELRKIHEEEEFLLMATRIILDSVA